MTRTGLAHDRGHTRHLLVAAGFLYQFGTSAIRGFATMLTIGLVANVFTAVFVSRTMFELTLLRPGARQVTQALQALHLSDFQIVSRDHVSAAVGDEMQRRGLYATMASIGAITVYIGIRFRLFFALGAIATKTRHCGSFAGWQDFRWPSIWSHGTPSLNHADMDFVAAIRIIGCASVYPSYAGSTEATTVCVRFASSCRFDSSIG